MTNKNLLAVLKPGDETHYLVKDFFQSLPEKSRKVFDSFGYIGNLEKNLDKFRKEDMRYFIVFSSPTFNDLITEYFSSTPEATLKEIPDRLKIKARYQQQDTNILEGARLVLTLDGSIDEMIKKYQILSSTDPRKLISERLNKSEFLMKNITKKTWFGLGKTKIVPTYVSVGLETPDGRYLLETTGAQGPYVGKF
ncbi:hypothetical protein KAR52_02285 [Candidatus Pacearchaeota archaeon]|nr:hypothetical protein [Candidatus Pacearchaeota archaeon]